MRCDIYTFLERHSVCIVHKAIQKPPAGYLRERPHLSRPFQMLSIDLMRSLPKSTKGYQYILLVCEYFSKFILSITLRNVPKICEYLENEVFSLFGAPQYLSADNKVKFENSAHSITHLSWTKLLVDSNVFFSFACNILEEYQFELKFSMRNFLLTTQLLSYFFEYP